MIGYGMAKAAVHQLVASLQDGKSGLPANTSVAAILPLVFCSILSAAFQSLFNNIFSWWYSRLCQVTQIFSKHKFLRLLDWDFYGLDALAVA